MRNALVTSLLIASLATGCHVSGPNAKSTATAVNVMLVGAGAAMVISGGTGDSSSCRGDASCYGGGLGDAGMIALGTMVAAAGAIGLLINIGRTGENTVATTARPATQATVGTVTAPGLASATVAIP